MRKFIITVNGNEYEVDVEEVTSGGASPSVRREEAPKNKPVAKKPVVKKEEAKKDVSVAEGEESVDAPMPGTILSINVSEGDSVAEGDILMILEAMKMENEILAPRSGVVKAIGASQGSAVDTGDKLVVLE